jgi:menaquinone-specific isochorismate synthase
MPDPDPTPSETPRPADVWAWLRQGDRAFHARGPLRQAALPAEGGISFYANDFALSDPLPWRAPGVAAALSPLPAPPAPVVDWESPDPEAFRTGFHELMDAVRRREILKAVPVASATGRVRSGDAGAWLRHVLTRPAEEAQGNAFAWMDGDAGMAGFTPEILFQIDGRRLTTMALAGTTDAAHAAELTERPKLAREHAVVVDELQRRLGALGEVRTGGREVVRQGNIRHLRTPMEVTLAEEPTGAALNDIIRLLHPTPALGISPRTDAAMALLTRCRTRTGTPAAFGAPFGVAWPGGALFVVAIRAAFWQGDHIQLPAGGGLVAGSEFENEWAELELKRAWVRRALGL